MKIHEGENCIRYNALENFLCLWGKSGASPAF
jgi:hypothetical protein